VTVDCQLCTLSSGWSCSEWATTAAVVTIWHNGDVPSFHFSSLFHHIQLVSTMLTYRIIWPHLQFGDPWLFLLGHSPFICIRENFFKLHSSIIYQHHSPQQYNTNTVHIQWLCLVSAISHEVNWRCWGYHCQWHDE